MISTQENKQTNHYDELINIKDQLIFEIKANFKLISMSQQRIKYYIANRNNYNDINEFIEDDRRRIKNYEEENKFLYIRLDLILNHIKLCKIIKIKKHKYYKSLKSQTDVAKSWKTNVKCLQMFNLLILCKFVYTCLNVFKLDRLV